MAVGDIRIPFFCVDSALYEYPHKDVGESEWGSYNFNHSRPEVASFLQSAANYWISEYHFDGLRMDAVSRLIYWQGDESRGENRSAIEFLRRMNKGLHNLHPTAVLIAEDSTAYPGVTKGAEQGGLGFDYKWDLLRMPAHDAFHGYIRELNRLYLSREGIWALDHTYDGFKWMDCGSDNPCVFGYIRTGKRGKIAVLLNFSDQHAAIVTGLEGRVNLLLHTDWEPFGGQTRRAAKRTLPDVLPPYSGVLYRCSP